MRTVKLAFLLFFSLCLAAPAVAAPRAAQGSGSGFAWALKQLVAILTSAGAGGGTPWERKGCDIDPNGRPGCVSLESEPEWLARKGCFIDPNGILTCSN
jgi:hypothetical protein